MVDPLQTEAIIAAIQQLAQDEALRRQLVQAGFQNVQRFSWGKTAEQTLDVLEKAARE